MGLLVVAVVVVVLSTGDIGGGGGGGGGGNTLILVVGNTLAHALYGARVCARVRLLVRGARVLITRARTR